MFDKPTDYKIEPLLSEMIGYDNQAEKRERYAFELFKILCKKQNFFNVDDHANDCFYYADVFLEIAEKERKEKVNE